MKRGLLLVVALLSLVLVASGALYPNGYTYCAAPNTAEVTKTNYTLELVQTITRHGDRTALTVLPGSGSFFCNLTTFMLPNSDSMESAGIPRLFRKNFLLNRNVIPGDCNFGQLTQKGLNQHIALGTNLRQLYVNTYKFLSGTLSDAEVWIRSTDIYRTVQSVQGNMQGFFPASPASGNSIPVVDLYTMDLSEENMYSNDATCPRYKQLYNQVISEPAYVSYTASFAPLKQKIATALGVSLDTFEWEDLFDAFNVINCHNGPLPVGITQDMVNQVYALNNWQYNFTLADIELTKLAIGSFVGELLNRINEKIAGTLPQKYMHYSGHDTTIAPLMTAFGVYDGNWPPYASHSQLELWSNAGQYYIQVKYQGTAFLLRGCNSTLCPIKQFLNNVAPYVITNPAECQVQSTNHVKVM